MSDIIPNVVISMPSQLFTLARKFQAASNGKIYIGKIDTDPTLPENQIQVYLENEDGSHIPVPQPLIINQAGFPVYNGQIAKFVTVEGHSMAVYDSYGALQHYYSNVLKYDPDQFDIKITPVINSKVQYFDDIESLRNSENIKSRSLYVIEYFKGSSIGGGYFYIDYEDKLSLDNGGTVIVNNDGFRIKRLTDTIRLSEFGIFNNSPLVTKENCEAAFKWGFENGYTKFETSISEITLDFPLHIKIPDDYIYDSIEINSSGVHKFKYDLVIQIPEWQHKKTDYLYAIFGNGKTRVNINLNFDNSGMGNSKPNTRGKTIGLRIDDCPNSYLNVFGKNNNGYGVWIVSSDNTEIKLVGRNLDGYQYTDVKDDSGNLVAFDDYGDALYIASNNITVSYLDVRTDRGGRAGVVFEGTFTKSESVNGQLNNFNIVGYDRGVHIESTKENMGSIFISNGRLLNNNTQILSFNGNSDKVKNRIDVSVDNVQFLYDHQISPYITEGRAFFSRGAFMLSGSNMNSSNCVFGMNDYPSVIAGNGTYKSANDTYMLDSSGLQLSYGSVEINNLNARATKKDFKFNGNTLIRDSAFGGNVYLTEIWGKYHIDNVTFSGNKTSPSGHLIFPYIRRAGYYSNITFDYVIDYAIDNRNENSKFNLPLINYIRVLSGDDAGRLFLPTNTTTNNRYIRSVPSYTLFGTIESEVV
ncbi:phage head-binding domain-containing protein [Proteus terrae]|uniref:phage head-binding domain-containing protein n=1 Tax=Proteus terrae TaxID=1574161 RepID=UPI00370AC81F